MQCGVKTVMLEMLFFILDVKLRLNIIPQMGIKDLKYYMHVTPNVLANIHPSTSIG